MNVKKEARIKHLLAINFLLKFIQSTIISINTHKQKMIEIGNKTKKIRNKINGTIVIIFLYCRCWGLIMIYRYYIGLKVLFVLKEQVTALMSYGYIINPTLQVKKTLR